MSDTNDIKARRILSMRRVARTYVCLCVYMYDFASISYDLPKTDWLV